MKTKKKPRGMKHRIREEREREERTGLAAMVAVLIIVILFSGFFINSILNQPSTGQPINSPAKPKAAIVDHLSLTYSNQTFIQTATTTLKQAGYKVDYYSSEKVTVEFYRNLPTHGYELIILRVHSGLNQEGRPPVILFTSEIYTTSKYIFEQLTNQLWEGRLDTDFVEGKTYFGIAPSFVTTSMKGKFENTIIIMMGCNGLTYTDMAQAFIQKGAKLYISWSDSVLASHTDSATTHLLQHFFIEKLTLKDSVGQTMQNVGPDPAYNAILQYYPLEAEDFTQNNIGARVAFSQNLTATITENLTSWTISHKAVEKALSLTNIASFRHEEHLSSV